jgi:GTPase SAR1 family protein
VYDITKERSFRSISNWLINLKSKVDAPVVTTIVGNKLDLAEKDTESRRVEYSKVLDFQKAN